MHSNMLMISFGMRTDSSSDALIAKALALTMAFMDLTGQYLTLILTSSCLLKITVGPWANAVEFFEPFQWIPTVKQSTADKLHDDLVDVYGSIIQRLKTLMDSGEEVPDCLVKMLIESQKDEKLDWEDLCLLSAAFMLGGSSFGKCSRFYFHEAILQILHRHLGSSNGSLL